MPIRIKAPRIAAEREMLTYSYFGNKKAGFCEKPVPELAQATDAVVRVTLSSVCTSDLHIIGGFVPRAQKGVTLGHEGVGIVEKTGAGVKKFAPGDRVAINVETFCGECFFCRNGYVNNCTDKNGGWALGCRIDGMQAPFVRVPYADNCLNKIPDGVSDRQALFVGDILATGYWAADIARISAEDEVLVLGGGPTGICCALCARLRGANVTVSEISAERRAFIKKNFPFLRVAGAEEALAYCAALPRGGADRVIEAAGGEDSFTQAWQAARPNAVVVLVAMYERAQKLPLPDMYGKNLTFKTGGVDGCKCDEILRLIAAGRLDTQPLITHTFPFERINQAFELFAAHADGVMKTAVTYRGV